MPILQGLLLIQNSGRCVSGMWRVAAFAGQGPLLQVVHDPPPRYPGGASYARFTAPIGRRDIKLTTTKLTNPIARL